MQSFRGERGGKCSQDRSWGDTVDCIEDGITRFTSLTSSARVFFSTWMTRSTTDTLGVGTRSAIPAHHSTAHSRNATQLLPMRAT